MCGNADEQAESMSHAACAAVQPDAAEGVQGSAEDETRAVLLGFLKGREYLFSLFHKLLGTLPSTELFTAASSQESLAVVDMFDDGASPAPAELRAALSRCADLVAQGEQGMQQAHDEYERLFFAPDNMVAAPWESVYTTRERALFQESTLAVRSWYERYLYIPAGYPRIPDDHIALMMHFLELTAARAAAHLEDGQPRELAKVLEDQAAFEREHLLNWVFSYAQDMASSKTHEVYPQLAQAVADFVQLDAAVLDEMLEIVASVAA